MRVSFLDFDGVINDYIYLKNLLRNKYEKITYADHFMEDKVKLYNDFAKDLGIKTIISSNWRFYFTLDGMIDLLRSKGLETEIIGITPYRHPDLDGDHRWDESIINEINPKFQKSLRFGNMGSLPPRGNLIFQKMKELGLTEDQIVIFDDRTDIEPLLSRFIRTNPNRGLTEYHITQAKNLFK